jgi:hypothetical protein
MFKIVTQTIKLHLVKKRKNNQDPFQSASQGFQSLLHPASGNPRPQVRRLLSGQTDGGDRRGEVVTPDGPGPGPGASGATPMATAPARPRIPHESSSSTPNNQFDIPDEQVGGMGVFMDLNI